MMSLIIEDSDGEGEPILPIESPRPVVRLNGTIAKRKNATISDDNSIHEPISKKIRASPLSAAVNVPTQDAWLPSTLDQNLKEYVGNSMISEGGSTVPEDTMSLLQLLNQPIDDGHRNLAPNDGNKSSLPWSEFIRSDGLALQVDETSSHRNIRDHTEKIIPSPPFEKHVSTRATSQNANDEEYAEPAVKKDADNIEDFVHVNDDTRTFTPDSSPSTVPQNSTPPPQKNPTGKKRNSKSRKKSLPEDQLPDHQSPHVEEETFLNVGFTGQSHVSQLIESDTRVESDYQIDGEVIVLIPTPPPISSVVDAFSNDEDILARRSCAKAEAIPEEIEKLPVLPEPRAPQQKKRGRKKKVQPLSEPKLDPESDQEVDVQGEWRTAQATAISEEPLPEPAEDNNAGSIPGASLAESNSDAKENIPPVEEKSTKPSIKDTSLSGGKGTLYRVGLSKRARIAPLLRVVKK